MIGGAAMSDQLTAALRRYIEQYGWRWPIVRNLINNAFGTSYSVEDLQQAYAASKEQP